MVEFEKINDLVIILEKKFISYLNLTIIQIKELLDNNNLFYTLEEINIALNILMVDHGKIVRDDYWSTEPIYKYISNYYFQNSSYTRHYYSFNIDDYSDKKFLLISDTHIGNPELENFNLLQNIYNYASKNGINKCFHLGDIFSGAYYEKWSQAEMERQMDLFIKYYPQNLDIKTYFLIGNHDEHIHGYFDYKPNYIEYTYDLRQLSRFRNNFYIIPRPFIDLKFSDVNINFSHKMFANWCNPKEKITDLNQICNLNTALVSRIDILVSGHLHKGFLCTNKFEEKEQLLLGVPSATNININDAVAYVISLNYNDNRSVNFADITILLSDNNYNISEGNTFKWKFKDKNKMLKRTINNN